MKRKLVNSFIGFRKGFTECKINIQRSLSYLAILNSGMILFLLLARLQDFGIEIHITKMFFPIFIASLVIMILIGYVDHRLGFHREEARRASKRNPYFDEIIDRLDRVEREVKKKK